jgi:phosphoribosylanthranilate isomerase
MTVEVKICGLKDAESIEAAIAAGANYIGLNFYALSPRYVTPEAARPLADLARGRVKIVALIVDADDALIVEIAAKVRPDFLQAHGSESPERIAGIASPADIAGARAFREAAAMILFDAKAPETLEGALPGGNGIAFDWSLLSIDARPRRFMLSGGLDAGNVQHAIWATGAPIVDVSSGVEERPGIKSPARIRNFIEKAKAVG